MSEIKGAIETIVAMGAAGILRTVEDHAGSAQGENPFLVIRHDYKVEDLEKFLPEPTRKRGTFQFEDTASFVAYVKKHKDEPATALYATFKDAPGRLRVPSFTAVFDDHSTDGPLWRQHKAVYDCPLSDEWKAWLASNKKPYGQEEFAQFIEDNLPDIVRPEGAAMVEISKSLQAKKSASFKSGIKLENGDVQFEYSEETKGTAANGTLEIPSEFVIAIPVIVNGPKVEIMARLRYRIPEGELTMWYDLLRPHKVIEKAFRDTWEAIGKETEIAVLHGKG